MKRWMLFCVLFFLPISAHAEPIEISAKSAIVLEYGTGQVLYAKDADRRLPMASTTKIMTALLALEQGELTDRVQISTKAAHTEGSSMYLKPGQSLSLETLLYGLMLSSGNDAAVAIAEHISGSEAAFAEAMTKRAHELGCINTQFKNANGLPNTEHFTTAIELARIAGKAMEHPKFREIVGTKTAVREGHSFSNHNKMLSLYEGATGIKTGYTKASGRTLVSAAKRNGIELICVTLQAPDDWSDHTKMLDLGFSKISLVPVAEKGEVCKTEPILNGIKNEAKLAFEDGFSLPVVQDKTVETRISIDAPLHAPLQAGEIVGKAEVFLDDVKMGEIPVCASEEISAMPSPKFFTVLLKIFRRFTVLFK